MIFEVICIQLAIGIFILVRVFAASSLQLLVDCRSTEASKLTFLIHE
jgi:hypothetical protein